MLADRNYMKQLRGGGPKPLFIQILIFLVAIFALQCINDVYLKTRAEDWLALTKHGLKHAWLWQLVTFQFLHNGLLHLAFNLITFWFLGRFCEDVLGRRRFLLALLGCGVVGGVLQGLLMLLFPGHFGRSVVGASAGVSGLLAIFALLERNTEVRFNFILPMRAIVLLYIFGGISLFFTLVPTPREMCVAHAAHLGGLLAGMAFVRLGWHRDFQPLPWEGLWQKLAQGFRLPMARPVLRHPIVRSSVRSNVPREEMGGDFISKEVDPILDKISAHGIQSLTERERKILEAARARMAGR